MSEGFGKKNILEASSEASEMKKQIEHGRTDNYDEAEKIVEDKTKYLESVKEALDKSKESVKGLPSKVVKEKIYWTETALGMIRDAKREGFESEELKEKEKEAEKQLKELNEELEKNPTYNFNTKAGLYRLSPNPNRL